VLTYQTPSGRAPVDVLLPGNRAALLDGMTKKRDDIPDATMKRLRALQAAVYAEFRAPKKGRS
jgi:hypothetical protein